MVGVGSEFEVGSPFGGRNLFKRMAMKAGSFQSGCSHITNHKAFLGFVFC